MDKVPKYTHLQRAVLPCTSVCVGLIFQNKIWHFIQIATFALLGVFPSAFLVPL